VDLKYYTSMIHCLIAFSFKMVSIGFSFDTNSHLNRDCNELVLGFCDLACCNSRISALAASRAIV
jgi:hypothetical protein